MSFVDRVFDKHFRLIGLTLLVAAVCVGVLIVVRGEEQNKLCGVVKEDKVQDMRALNDPDSLIRQFFPALENPKVLERVKKEQQADIDELPC